MGTGFTIVQGGKGANQAVASARAGGDVVFISCVGDDLFGRNTVDALRNEAIDTSLVKVVKEVPTGVAMIQIDEKGENSICVAPGANNCLYSEDILSAENAIGEADVLLIQLEIPVKTVETAIILAKKHKTQVILNPAPVNPFHASQLPAGILSNADIITPNLNEAEWLTDTDPSVSDYSELLVRLRKSATGIIVMTLGGNGSACLNQKKITHFPAVPVRVTDTTAAGDTFNGYLAVALAKGYRLDKAITLAVKAASLSVTKLGAQSSIPYAEEVDLSPLKSGKHLVKAI
jgi:ribokinase